MTFEETTLIDAYVITPNVFGDHRGYFMESFNKKCLEEIIGPLNFVQDNQSLSSKGVLRGLHHDNKTWKMVSCLHGKIYFCLLYTSPSPRDVEESRMPSSA